MTRAQLFLAVGFAAALTTSRLDCQVTDSTGRRVLHSLDSLRRSDPRLYRTTRNVVVIGAQMTLGRLGFGPVGFSGTLDSSTASAVRRFERSRGLPITGHLLTPATYARIATDAQAMNRADTRPSLGTKRFYWNDGALLAEGPWLMDGEPDSYMRVDIYCDRDATSYFGPSSTLGECRLFWARLGRGFMNSSELMILSEHFAVDTWDDSEILSKPRDYPCTRYILRINRIQETVVMTRSTISQSEDCRSLEVRDVITRLGGATDPFEVSPDADQVLKLYNFGPAARAAFRLQPQ